MNGEWIRPAAFVASAGVVGTLVRLGLHGALGHEVVALAAVNVVGWFLLGLVSGRYGARLRHLRLALAVLGVSAFTSWMSLVVDGVSASGEIVVAFIEVIFGLAFAGLGHLLTMPRGPDLLT